MVGRGEVEWRSGGFATKRQEQASEEASKLKSGECGNAVRWVDNVGDATRMALALYEVSQARCHGLGSDRSPLEEPLTVSESARLI
jgi:hypothetical protein